MSVDGERRKVEADLGPVKYLATLLGRPDEDVLRLFITEPYAFEKEAYGRIVGRTYQMCFPQRVTK
jgi:hypothetical protein